MEDYSRPSRLLSRILQHSTTRARGSLLVEEEAGRRAPEQRQHRVLEGIADHAGDPHTLGRIPQRAGENPDRDEEGIGETGHYQDRQKPPAPHEVLAAANPSVA